MDIIYAISIIIAFWAMREAIRYYERANLESASDPRLAGAASAFCGFVVAGFMMFDPFAAAILLALGVSGALARKFDSISLIIGVLVAIGVPFIALGATAEYLAPAGMVVAGLMIDEAGIAAVGLLGRAGPALAKLFEFRITTHIFLGTLLYLGQLPVLYWIAFAFFDIGYRIFENRAGKQEAEGAHREFFHPGFGLGKKK